MPLKPVKTVIFDLDGVLITTGPFTQHLAREHGITPDQVRPFFARDFPACLVGQADLRTCVTPWLVRWGWPGDADTFLEFWFSTERPTEEDLRLLAIVSRLRAAGLPCALATNQERHRLAYLRTRLGFATRFDHIFASSELGHAKPHPGFFAAVEARLAPVLPEELLFFDDRPENVAAARARRWHAELFTDPPAVAAVLTHHGVTF